MQQRILSPFLVLSAALASALLGACESSKSESPADYEGPATAWCQAKAVIDEHCTACHDGKGSAGTPMGLTSFKDLTANSEQFPGSKIYERVHARIHDTKRPMPPQGGMSDEDLKALDEWIAAGAPQGEDLKCDGIKSSDSAYSDNWPTDCDATYKLTAHDPADPKKPFVFPANSEDHPQIYFDAPWGDEEVQAIAMRPITDNKRILHHWILYQNAGGRAFVTGWAPGKDEREPLPDDVGLFLPSGANSLRLDMHYNNLGNTKAEADASGVEICVVKKDRFRPKTATVFENFASYGAGFPPVLAPARSIEKSVTGTCVVSASEPVHLLTASPHAHKLATHMKFVVKRVDGTEIVMHDKPFSFEEQQSYAMPEEIILNTGDVVTTTCTYTNPSDANVRFGEDTGNEMCFNFAVYYPMNSLSCSNLPFDLGGLFGGTGAQ